MGSLVGSKFNGIINRIMVKITMFMLCFFVMLNSCRAQNEAYYTSIDKALTNPKSVKTLDLNDIIITDAIYEFKNLEALYLMDCPFDTIADRIKRLKKLKVLRIRSCKLGILPKSIKKLKNLEELTITGSHQSVILFELKKLKKLRTVSLANNNISSLRKSFFFNANEILSVNLSGNKLRDLPKSIYSLDKLKKLLIMNNSLTYLHEELLNLQNLKELHVEKNKITVLPNKMSLLTKLEILHVKNNLLKNIQKELLNKCSLKTLDLSDNRISTLPVFENACIKKFVLTGNPITPLRLAKLREQIPNGEVLF